MNGSNKRFPKKRKQRYHTLPPHTWEPQPLADTAEVHKSILIAIIAIVAITLLSLLLFFNGQFVGKAYSIGENSIDLQYVGNTIAFTATLPSVTTNGVYFEMTSETEGMDICALLSAGSINNRLWDQFQDIRCSDNRLIFADATLDPAQFLGGTFTLVELVPAPPQDLTINVNVIDIYDSATGKDLFPAGQRFTLVHQVAGTPPPAQPEGTPPAPVVSGGSEGGGGGEIGGSGRCFQRWSCVGEWSYCNATLQQSRTCYDRENCPNVPVTKLENRSCTQCDESWVCTEWSGCQNGIQTRDCSDEHSCTTARTKPWLQKSCQQTVVPGPVPARIIQQAPPTAPPVIQRPAPPVPSFWEQYKTYLIAGGSGLLVLIAIILIIVHFVRPQHLVYNMDELKEWVRKERDIGTSNQEIQKILAQHTGWKPDEIQKVLT